MNEPLLVEKREGTRERLRDAEAVVDLKCFTLTDARGKCGGGVFMVRGMARIGRMAGILLVTPIPPARIIIVMGVSGSGA